VACGGSGALSDGQGPINRTKWSQRTNWTVGDFTVGYNWRHLSGVQEEPGGPSFLAAFSTIKAYDYLDLSATWNFNKMLRLSVAINNLTDKKPPLVGNTIGSTTANSGNTFPQTYDTIGRFYSLGLGLKF
jgi:outer membrane receptor protein involved in Fe transport